MAAKEIAVKKYVVKLSSEERERLETLIRSGKHPARKLNRARILLKADASDAGEAWSDSRIAVALDTAEGARPVDVASAGRQGRGTEHRCPGQRQHDRADAKKTFSNRT